MEPIKFEGMTRIIGEAQGYLGLPLQDTTINDSVTGPGTPVMLSLWKPSEAERQAIADGCPITLSINGTQHPPAMLSVSDLTPADEDAAQRHDRLAREVVNRIIRETVGRGHKPSEALILMESALVGVSLALIRLGGDNAVLDIIVDRARQRLAEIRLKETEGSA